jgi:hypothetical protein
MLLHQMVNHSKVRDQHRQEKNRHNQKTKINKQMFNKLQWILINSNSHQKTTSLCVCICLFFFVLMLQLRDLLCYSVTEPFLYLLSDLFDYTQCWIFFIYFFFTESGFYSDFVLAFLFYFLIWETNNLVNNIAMIKKNKSRKKNSHNIYIQTVCFLHMYANQAIHFFF